MVGFPTQFDQWNDSLDFHLGGSSRPASFTSPQFHRARITNWWHRLLVRRVDRRLIGSIPNLRHQRRCPDFPGYGSCDAQNAEYASPGSLRESKDSCYKQECRANSANAGQHEHACDGEQHRHHCKDRSKQAFHTDLRRRISALSAMVPSKPMKAKHTRPEGPLYPSLENPVNRRPIGRCRRRTCSAKLRISTINRFWPHGRSSRPLSLCPCRGLPAG